MNKWLKIVIGIVVVFVVAVTAMFVLTAGMVDTADAFFDAIKQRDIAKARGYLAEDFKASTDERALTDFLSKGAILNFKEASWPNRQTSGGRGELNGSVTTETGGVVPLKMMFVKENDAWKIYAIQKPTAGLQSEDASPTAPTKSDQVALVKQSVYDFIVSVEKKDMEHFRGSLSRLWQREVTPDALHQAFKSVIDADVNWAGLNSLEPVLAADGKVDDAGVLMIAGHYATAPKQIHFEQKFIYEGLAWKLVGFGFHTN